MRMALAGLLAAGGLVTTLYFGWSGIGWSGSPLRPGSAAEESSWQLRELAFLKAAYDRTERDMARPTEASASLHAEQKRIVQRMTETAKLLPAETVPPELRALLPDTEAAPVSLSRLIETIAADGPNPDLAESPPLDLRVGLRAGPRVVSGAPRPGVRAAEFAVDPELREPIRHEPAAERAERTPRRKPRDETGRNQP